jgi:hypothetical protein
MSSSAVSVTPQAVSTGSTEARLAQLANALSYAVLAGGAATIALAVYVAVLGHSKLPFWDEWMQIDFAANEGPGHTLDWLWRQFNQHRIVVPKLFLLADLRWFRATQTSLLVSNLCLQLLHLTVLGWSMRVLGGWRGARWRTALGLVAFCLFCPSQWSNLVMGLSGLCFLLPPLFASLSVLGLLLYWRYSREDSLRSSRWKYLVLCIAAALCATFSLSNGNLVWPLLVLAALLLRLRLAALTIAAAAAAGICAFFYNYTVYITPSSLSSPAELIGLAQYIAVYFGSSWVTANIRTAEVLGIMGFLMLAVIAWHMPSYFKAAPAISIQFGALLLFALATGVVTAPGRIVFGLDQAFSGRYQSFALLFWGCMGVLLLGQLTFRGTRGGFFLLSQVAVLGILLFAASKTEALLLKVRWQGFNVNLAGVALEVGVPDNSQLAWAHSRASYPRSLVPFLRDHKLSIFTEPEPYLLGQPLNAEFRQLGLEDCAGEVESTAALTRGWPRSLRITGWAWDTRDREAPRAIIVTTDGIVSGLGLTGDWRPDKRVSGQDAGDFTGFTAYVRDVSRSNTVDLYAASRKDAKAVCHIATINPESRAIR